jgi:DNA transposition AAA+ family ATPase
MPKYPTDPALTAELLALRAEQGITNSQLCRLLAIDGCTPTFLSKYLNDNLDREVEGFAAKARDTIKGIRERIEFGSEIFETSVVRRIGNCLNLIRKTGDVAAITSPAGNGKTSAVNHYLAANPSAIRINLNATTRDANRVENLVFRGVDNRDWKAQCSRFEYLVARFKGASRLLIVDNAQRLTSSGRQWIFDFADEAQCPVCLIGNPEMIDRIRTNDQQFSRIGIHATYELEDKELPAAAARVAAQFSDSATAEAIADLCAFIAAREGRLRAVRKTVVLAQELRNASADLRENPRKAIRAAHARLVRDYELPHD